MSHRRQDILTAALLVLLSGTLNSASAQNNHYRWLNERGEPVYSDRPPPQGVDYEVVSTVSTQKRVVTANEGAVLPEVDSRVGNEFEEVDPAKASEKNPELCNRAKTNLESLTSSDKVKIRNSQGEVRFLSPAEMEEEAKTARAQVRTYCE